MYLSVENRANRNASVLVRAEGVPAETAFVHFRTSNQDYTTLPPSMGSASWYFSSAREGMVTVTAEARDAHGMNIASARASVMIVDPVTSRRGAFDLSGHSRSIQARTDTALKRPKKP